jgi:class 3 adenylate cyclase/predicted ATPase
MSAVAEVDCPSCGEPTPAAGRFCIHCGVTRQQSCPSCGQPLVPGARFCMQCGVALVEGAAAPPPATAPAPVSERRLVSVLFADLVGFTALSEHRDPEEVRELLSGYFDRCRTLIERYGGTVEKFIGDAVMAVWGTPVAREDDAERAVRAALALTQSITALGTEVGMPELRVRAGVLTGNAAVEVGAEGEGMVLGDTVNTASRLQSVAAPGTVLVDDVTRRASEAAIAYEDAGSHAVKGREQEVRAWTALRVVAGAGGARRSAGLEAPFVGRDAELQTMIEVGEASAGDRRAKLVAVVGEAGSGKSRLLWEFFKYLDGIEDERWWHQGRCLSYGEGVAYWALAEMVRARARIQEEEDPSTAREKLRAVVEQFVPDDRERRLVEPRLAHLLRLEERPDADRVDLFSGWRLFFERMAETLPVILAFEDLQWADSGLLDFIDYVLEWSADYPIFVLALGRPELRERRPGWQPLNLEPLEPQSITRMLDALAPDLPGELVAEIGHRAEGIPLYAVETIRMLQDRGVLTQEGSSYVVTGEVSELEVPETLHALVASRLDGLSAAERSLLQDASVLGQSFTAAAAAAVSDIPGDEVGGVLDRLVTKQVLTRDDDPRSPERGQYVFLQALLRTVAYGMLSRRARKSRHVDAARYLERTWPGEARDIAEVLAAHYLQAIEAEPDAPDADELRSSARETLTAAGRAAASLALGSEADNYFTQAAELTPDELERAGLLEQAGRSLWRSGESDKAELRLREAVELHQRNGRASGGPAAVTLATTIATSGRADEGKQLIEHFLASEGPEGDQVLRAQALAALGNWLSLRGEAAAAEPLFAEALGTLESGRALPELAEAFARRAINLDALGRFEESTALARRARELAEEQDVPGVALRAAFQLAALLIARDRHLDALPEINRAVETARERGDRPHERHLLAEVVQCTRFLGRWEEAMELAPELLTSPDDAASMFVLWDTSELAAARGDEELLARCVEFATANRDDSSAEIRAIASIVLARAAFERGDIAAVPEILEEAVASVEIAGEANTAAFALATDAVLASGDQSGISALLDELDALSPLMRTPVRLAQRARLLAEQAHRAGDAQATLEHEHEALELLRAVGAKPLVARVQLDDYRRRRDADALAEARAIYTELGATRWLAQIDETAEVVA